MRSLDMTSYPVIVAHIDNTVVLERDFSTLHECSELLEADEDEWTLHKREGWRRMKGCPGIRTSGDMYWGAMRVRSNRRWRAEKGERRAEAQSLIRVWMNTDSDTIPTAVIAPNRRQSIAANFGSQTCSGRLAHSSLFFKSNCQRIRQVKRMIWSCEKLQLLPARSLPSLLFMRILDK